jgi:hypothetical protein
MYSIGTMTAMGLVVLGAMMTACGTPGKGGDCLDEYGCRDAARDVAVSHDATSVVDPLDRDEDGDGVTPREGDCNDAQRGIHPRAWDRPGDGVDQDCDGTDMHLCGDGVGYQSVRLVMWEVCVSDSLLAEEPVLATDVVERLRSDLEVVSGLMPKEVVARLTEVRIWVEREAFGDSAAVYHPSVVWLEENGYPSYWAESVQIANAKHYLSWLVQPAMILHELAHAWHHQVLGFDEPGILAAYDNAVSGGTYDDVLYPDGSKAAAYALTDHKEYFAELTEALYWQNDIYPLTEEDCLKHDPEGSATVLSGWSKDHLP